MREPLGVGIIGAGFIGRVHVKAARLAGGRVVGVVDSSLASSEALAHELRIDKVFGQADDLIADPDVNVVHVCVPNYLHAQLVAKRSPRANTSFARSRSLRLAQMLHGSSIWLPQPAS